ncbi:hypothetical protein V6N12_024186 [Hibiscus sabdariffa]|uniref:Uncharacterized protein n=1 Tax=Hibiscus sabdariffa TaxID=183260 RepID=A0ABR2FZV4_9ROSI
MIGTIEKKERKQGREIGGERAVLEENNMSKDVTLQQISPPPPRLQIPNPLPLSFPTPSPLLVSPELAPLVDRLSSPRLSPSIIASACHPLLVVHA